MIIWTHYNAGAKREGVLLRVIEASHLSIEIQQVTSNVAIAEKNEKQYVRLQLTIPRTHGTFSDKVTPDIYDFTDEPLF